MLPVNHGIKNMKYSALRRIVLVAGLIVMGCGRPAAEKPVAEGSPPPRKETERPASIVSPAPGQPAQQPVTPLPAQATESAAAGRDASALEQQYQAAGDVLKKAEIIFQISELDTLAGVNALGRLFQGEQDTELRVQLLEALEDIEGHTDAKLAILSIGAQPGQPEEVREAVIDALLVMNEPRGLWILQMLLNDPSEDVREDAKIAMEVLRAAAPGAADNR
jgi:hypothetical protein